jgi:hypothetical protein
MVQRHRRPTGNVPCIVIDNHDNPFNIKTNTIHTVLDDDIVYVRSSVLKQSKLWIRWDKVQVSGSFTSWFCFGNHKVCSDGGKESPDQDSEMIWRPWWKFGLWHQVGVTCERWNPGNLGTKISNNGLFWIDKVTTKENTYLWVSVQWETKGDLRVKISNNS